MHKFQRYDREVDAGKIWENKVIHLSDNVIHLSGDVICPSNNVRKERLKLFGKIEATCQNKQVGSSNGPLLLKLNLSGETMNTTLSKPLTHYLLPTAIRCNFRKTYRSDWEKSSKVSILRNKMKHFPHFTWNKNFS